MVDLLRRLRRIALRRAQQEFQRWDETWNPPNSLLGTAVVAGLAGAVLCQLVTMVATIILAWELRYDPEFWFLVFAVGFNYGALPGMALGAISGLAQALVWTRRSRLAGLACLAGGALVLLRLTLIMRAILHDFPGRDTLLQLLLLFCAALLWGALLLVYGVKLTLRKP